MDVKLLQLIHCQFGNPDTGTIGHQALHPFPLPALQELPGEFGTGQNLSGLFSLSPYIFSGSITRAGSSPCSRVLYMPAAWVMFRGTQTWSPLMELITMLRGDPECQIPSSRCPRVRIINGAICAPLVLQCRVARSSLTVSRA